MFHAFAGRSASPSAGASEPAGQRYEYDPANRLTSVWRTQGTATTSDDERLLELRYDALGRRVESIEHVDASDGSALTTPKRTWHVYNGYEPIVEFDVADTGTGGLAVTHARDFVWGAGFPEPLHMVDFTDAGDVPADGQTGGGPEVLTYLHDPLGSVIGLTNTNGELVEQYVYDPYGKTYVEDGSGSPRATSHYGNPWQWTGQRFDPTTLQYHFTFRTYSPSLGRWLQRDPLGYVDGVSLYEYAGGSPLVWVDPYGLQAWYEGWGTTFRIFFQQPVDHWLAQDVHDDMASYTRATTQHRQGYIDYVSMVPGPGVLADGVNAALHAANGEMGEAALSIAGTVPFGESAKGSRVLGSVDGVGNKVGDAATAANGANQTVIGELKDLDNLGPGENTLLKHLPDQGNPKLNWEQNSGVLRQEMGKGKPIRDASVDPATGELIDYPGSFLNAERNLLRDKGWTYDPATNQWSPPQQCP